MTKRENLMRTLRRQGWDELPCDIELTPPKAREYRRKHPLITVSSYFRLSHRMTTCFYRKSYKGKGLHLFSHQELPNHFKVDSWGIGMSSGSDEAYHMCHFHSPMEGDSVTAQSLQEYPLPRYIPGLSEAWTVL